jgi:hypothetical protein
MDFRAQYLQVMRERAPALFKRLSQQGEIELHASEQELRSGADVSRDNEGRAER